MIGKLQHRVDPEALDRQAKQAQRALISRHGGDATVMAERGGFSYSPPPGMSWKAMGARDRRD